MLDEKQYASSEKYEARIELHKRFRKAPQSKSAWLFDGLPQGENLSVLELGCGTGLFWLANRGRIPASWRVTLSDYSEGMLDAARRTLARVAGHFSFARVDAENIGFPDETFDIVIASNMLYHVENRRKALAGIRRCLKENGALVATTMGRDDMRELHALLYEFLAGRGVSFRFPELAFSLDNGREQLAEFFPRVTMEKFANTLEITEADPILRYYLSFNGMRPGADVLPESAAAGFLAFLQTRVDNGKTLSVTKDEGRFVCRKTSGEARNADD